jgi:hypothetical protein
VVEQVLETPGGRVLQPISGDVVIDEPAATEGEAES